MAKSKTLHIRVPAELHEMVTDAAGIAKRKLSDWGRLVLEPAARALVGPTWKPKPAKKARR